MSLSSVSKLVYGLFPSREISRLNQICTMTFHPCGQAFPTSLASAPNKSISELLFSLLDPWSPFCDGVAMSMATVSTHLLHAMNQCL